MERPVPRHGAERLAETKPSYNIPIHGPELRGEQAAHLLAGWRYYSIRMGGGGRLPSTPSPTVLVCRPSPLRPHESQHAVTPPLTSLVLLSPSLPHSEASSSSCSSFSARTDTRFAHRTLCMPLEVNHASSRVELEVTAMWRSAPVGQP